MGFKVTETNVDAVKGEDGRIYSLQQSYKKVDEYDSSKRRCWIYTKSRNSIGKLIDLFTASTFYEKNTDGSYTKIKNLSSITFSCDKRWKKKNAPNFKKNRKRTFCRSCPEYYKKTECGRYY